MPFFFNIEYLFLTVISIVGLIYWILTFVVLYHLTRFGVGTQPKKLAAVFLLGSVILFSISLPLMLSFNANSIKEKIENIIIKINSAKI